MSDNVDKFKNNKDEVKAMNLMAPENTISTKLPSMDAANRNAQ